MRDRTNATTARISLASGNVQANGSSGSTAISADGRFVAFQSQASNLVAGDSNGQGDIFLRGRINETTTRLSVSTSGVQANGSSVRVSVSGDGRFVAFTSEATNLVAGDTNARSDVFLRDRGLFSGFAASCSPCSPEGDTTSTVKLKRRLRRDVSRRFLIARLDATNKVREPNEKDNVIVSERLSPRRIRLRVRQSQAGRSVVDHGQGDQRQRPRAAQRHGDDTGAGVERVTGRTGRNGTVSFSVTAPQPGTVKIRAYLFPSVGASFEPIRASGGGDDRRWPTTARVGSGAARVR